MLGPCRMRQAVLGCMASWLFICLCVVPAMAQDDQQTPDVLWDDFNHYVLVARPDLASASGQKLLDSTTPEELLDVVEQSDFANYLQALDRAAQIEEAQAVAKLLLEDLRTAAMNRARDKARIANDIKQLAAGRRPAAEATRRLKAAGQYAAPQLLAVLEDDRQQDLHPFVMRAMVAIGPEMVYPLAAATPKLEPVPLGRVAQVLAELGYPQAIAPLKQVLDRNDLDPDARRTVETALSQLLTSQNLTPDLTAAQLYLLRAIEEFDQGTRGVNPLGSDEQTDTGVLWVYNRSLSPVNVPLIIYPDVLTMNSSERALKLDTSLASALSMFLMSNFRRENRLPEDTPDPSYGVNMQTPMFYAMLAGPQRLHEVLQTGLDNRDPDLALDAIRALTATAGTAALLKEDSPRQALIEAMIYPDRRVRFEAAMALANARPKALFPNAFRVVNVLAEAVRQGDKPAALVLGDDQKKINALNVLLTGMGYEVVAGASQSDVSENLATLPGVDLIVVAKSDKGIRQAIFDSQTDYRQASAPVLLIAAESEYPDLLEVINADPRVFGMIDTDETDAITAEVTKVTDAFGGGKIDQAQSTEYALRALSDLEDIAKGASIYQPGEAELALVHALGDGRPEVATAAANVLALLDSATAQQALATASLKQTGDLQIVMLNALADSATHYGNKLDDAQTQKLNKLVDDSTGPLADAAARAHGALELPTSNAVTLINKDAGTE